MICVSLSREQVRQAAGVVLSPDVEHALAYCASIADVLERDGELESARQVRTLLAQARKSGALRADLGWLVPGEGDLVERVSAALNRGAAAEREAVELKARVAELEGERIGIAGALMDAARASAGEAGE